MPTFRYRARSLSGEEAEGTRDAEDLPTLGRLLREEGLLLIEAKAVGEKTRGFRLTLPFRRGVSLADRMMATRHLAVLLDAGIDLPRALTTLSRQTTNERFEKILLDLAGEIRRGRRLSEALEAYPKIFGELYVAMVAAGEESGKLVESLRLLGEQLEKQHRLRSRIRGAMMYPLIVIIAMVLIGIAMFIFIVPQLESVFGDLGVALPPQTKAIFWLSHAMVTRWYFFLSGAVAIGYALKATFNLSWARHARSAILMRAPVFKKLLREIASARLARTLSSLVSSGVPIVRALEITARVVGNVAFEESLLEAARAVERGKSIHETLAAYPSVYPPLVIEMAAVGEESGKFSDVFADLATFYEEEVDQKTQSLSTIVEPLLMIVIGAVVGFFVISLMGPMYKLIGTL
jgi:type IV pilus assembly protein PilC